MGRHQGNVYFRQVIELHLEQYNRSNKLQKGQLTANLVKQIKLSGVRFLKQQENSSSSSSTKKKNNTGWWIEVNDDVARGKVSHAFRNTRLLKKGTMTTIGSPTNSSYGSSNVTAGGSGGVGGSPLNMPSSLLSADYISDTSGGTGCKDCFCGGGDL